MGKMNFFSYFSFSFLYIFLNILFLPDSAYKCVCAEWQV